MANNRIQVKRTSTTGRTPNTTNSGNTQYIAAGEFALNMSDQILYTSDGTNLISVGANQVNQRITNSFTIDSNKPVRFLTVNTSSAAYFIQQNDDNFVFYTTNTSYGARPVYSIFANSNNSEFSFATPVRFNANVTALTANGSIGTAGQVLTSNGTTVYWSTVASGGGTVTSVGSGSGLTGGPITTSGTLSVLANNGISSNSTGVFAVSGLGTVVNSTGINVNANNGITATAAGVFVTGNSGLTVNSSGVHVLANTGIIANSTGTFVNWGAPSVIGGTTANGASLTYANVSGQVNTATLYAATSANIASIVQANSLGVHVGANVVANTTALRVGNTTITTTNAVFGGTVAANGGIGTSGQVLTSGGAGNVYWTTPQIGDITAVTAGNGLTGGGTTGDVTLDVGAANGITVSADAVGAVVGSTQTLNSTGIHVNTNLSITTLTTTGNITLGNALSANGSTGTSGFVLKSGGSANAYWAADTDTNTTYDLLAIANTTTNQGIVRLKDVNNSNDDIQFTGANGVFVSSNATHVLITGQINTDTDTNTTYDLLAIANTEANAGRLRLKDVNNSNDDVIISGANGIIVSSNATHIIVTDTLSGDITSVTAGNGLTGGGTGGDVTLDVGVANGITVTADAVGAVVGSTQTLNSTGIHVNTNLSITTLTTSGNITLGASFSANGGFGSAGQVLKSSGSGANAYWAADTDTNTTYDLLAIANTEANAGRLRLKDVNNSNDDVIVTGANGVVVSSNATHIIVTGQTGDITSVTAGNGLTGGGTSGDVSLAVQAGTDGGLVSNSTGVWVLAGNGLLTNSTGLHVGSANGITVAADTVGALVGSTQTLNSTGIHVNTNLSITTLTTTGNITLGAAFSANGSTGTAGFVLKSGGTANAYWAADTDTNTTYDLLTIANTTTNQGIVRLKDVNNSNDDIQFTGANGVFVSSNATHVLITGQINTDTDTNTTYDLLAIANTEANAGRIRLKDVNNSNDDVIVTGANGIIVSSNATHIIVTDTLSGDITSVTAGDGLTGGGTGGDVTLNVVGGNGITVAADSVSVNGGSTLTVNSAGAHVNSTLSITTLTTSGNVIIGAGVSANGGVGTAGFVLKSGGSGANVYWAADNNSGGTVTSVGSGNGLTGGPITTSGSLAVQAGTDGGLVSNSTGVWVSAGSGLVTNSTGLHAGSGNGISITADAIAVNGGSTLTVNTAGAHVNSTLSITTLTTTGNVTLGAGISANGGVGSAGQVLKSGGSGANVYWAADLNSGTVTSIASGNGIIGGTITTTGTLYVDGANGISVDASGVNVLVGNTQLVSNATGVWITQSQIDHNSLSNYVADRHIAHSTVAITAGNGLTGGGNIDASRTLDVGAGNGITVAADSVSVNGGSTLTVNSAGAHVNTNLTLTTLVTTGNVGIGTTNTTAYALNVNGSFAATTKSFVIDHPTKSDMKLRYGSLEGPENGVYVRGRTNTGIIDLPDYWTGLIDQDSISVNLTAIGRKQELYVKEIANNKVIIAGSRNIDCYYTVFAERKDVVKLVVEF